MITFTEGRHQITIIGEVSARKFDDTTHRMSHCMKAVDFIIEYDDRYVFVEFKDLQNPKAPVKEQQRAFERFDSGDLDQDLQYKYRDSFLYEWASGRANKPIFYYVLCAWEGLDSTSLGRRTDVLKSKLPLNGPDGTSWPIARGCAVFNLESWNRTFPEHPVSQLF